MGKKFMEKVKIETYKGIDIFFDKDTSNLFAKDKKTRELFTGKYLFEVKSEIDEPVWEVCNEKGFIKDGLYNEIYLVYSNKQDKKSKEYLWVKGESTGNSYYKGTEVERNYKGTVIYPFTESNLEIFKEAKILEQDVNKVKRKLMFKVGELKLKED